MAIDLYQAIYRLNKYSPLYLKGKLGEKGKPQDLLSLIGPDFTVSLNSSKSTEPQTKSFSLQDVWEGFTKFIGLKQEAKKVVATLKDETSDAETQKQAADQYIDTLIKNGVFTSDDIAEIKNYSLSQKKDLIFKLTEKIRESNEVEPVRNYRDQADKVFAVMSSAERNNEGIIRAKIHIVRVTEDKVETFSMVLSAGIRNVGLTEVDANKYDKDLLNLARIVNMDKNLAAEEPSLLADVKEKIDHNTIAIQQNATALIEVATAKGYKLDNFAELAGIAGVAVSEKPELVTASDIVQLNWLSRFKLEFTNLMKDVMEQLAKNRQENRELDEASAKIVTQKKAEEAAYIRKTEIKIEELKKIIKNIQNKKLQNKLNVAVIVLSYMLKNPEERTNSQIETIRDYVNKIKLQVINNK
jgi:hypothetical protein